MGISKKRRLKKEVKRLTDLLESDVNSFLKVWNHRVGTWLLEMRSVARKLSTEKVKKNDRTVELESKDKQKKDNQMISCVWKRADDLIKACGEKVEALVGNQTRSLLDAECAKLIAQVYEPRTYRMTSVYKRLEDPKAARK